MLVVIILHFFWQKNLCKYYGNAILHDCMPVSEPCKQVHGTFSAIAPRLGNDLHNMQLLLLETFLLRRVNEGNVIHISCGRSLNVFTLFIVRSKRVANHSELMESLRQIC